MNYRENDLSPDVKRTGVRHIRCLTCGAPGLEYFGPHTDYLARHFDCNCQVTELIKKEIQQYHQNMAAPENDARSEGPEKDRTTDPPLDAATESSSPQAPFNCPYQSIDIRDFDEITRDMVGRINRHLDIRLIELRSWISGRLDTIQSTIEFRVKAIDDDKSSEELKKIKETMKCCRCGARAYVLLPKTKEYNSGWYCDQCRAGLRGPR